MPAVLKLPIQKHIMLMLPIEEDAEQDSYVDIRQATQREVEKRAELTANASRIFREGQKEVEVKQRWSIEEQRRLEVYLVMADCNLVGTDNKPLFRFRQSGSRSVLAMSEDEFNEIWGQMPEYWVTAIHKAVIEVNVQWDPNWTG